MIRTFSLYLTEDNNSSQLIFGGYDPSLLINNAQFTYLKVLPGGFWDVPIESITLGNNTINNIIKIGRFSSADPILIPDSDWQSFKQQMDGLNCQEQILTTSIIALSCSCNSSDAISSFPSLSFVLGNSSLGETYTITLTPQDYITFLGNSMCQTHIGIQPNGTAWILGIQVMRHAYMMFDMDSAIIGLAINA